jgi:hypothetical protein
VRQEAYFNRQEVIDALRCEAVAQGLDVPPASECGVQFKLDSMGRNLRVVLTWESR